MSKECLVSRSDLKTKRWEVQLLLFGFFMLCITTSKVVMYLGFQQENLRSDLMQVGYFVSMTTDLTF